MSEIQLPFDEDPKPTKAVNNSPKKVQKRSSEIVQASKESTEQATSESTKKIKGPVKIKKPGVLKQFWSGFIVDDLGTAKDYVVSEILVPYAKKIVKEILDSTLDSIFYGNNAPRSHDNAGNRGAYSNYNSYTSYSYRYGPNNNNNYAQNDRRAYTRPYADLGQIIMRDRQDAVNCLDCMQDTINNYGTVTVADVYDYIGVQSRYTDRDYGWTQLNTARIEGTRDGFALVLPQPRPLPKDN